MDRLPRTDAVAASPSKLGRLWRAYPVHPPLTDVAIGAYTTASLLGVLGISGVAEASLANAWWLALLVGAGAAVLSALAGFVDFAAIGRRDPARRVAIAHMLLMLATFPLFVEALRRGHAGYGRGEIATTPLVLTLIGFALLLGGGSLGGKLVYEHGLRVEPAVRARQVEGERRGAG